MEVVHCINQQFWFSFFLVKKERKTQLPAHMYQEEKKQVPCAPQMIYPRFLPPINSLLFFSCELIATQMMICTHITFLFFLPAITVEP